MNNAEDFVCRLEEAISVVEEAGAEGEKEAQAIRALQLTLKEGVTYLEGLPNNKMTKAIMRGWDVFASYA